MYSYQISKYSYVASLSHVLIAKYIHNMILFNGWVRYITNFFHKECVSTRVVTF